MNKTEINKMSENDIILNILTLSKIKGISNKAIARILKQDILLINDIVGDNKIPCFYMSSPCEGISTLCEFETTK